MMQEILKNARNKNQMSSFRGQNQTRQKRASQMLARRFRVFADMINLLCFQGGRTPQAAARRTTPLNSTSGGKVI